MFSQYFSKVRLQINNIKSNKVKNKKKYIFDIFTTVCL